MPGTQESLLTLAIAYARLLTSGDAFKIPQLCSTHPRMLSLEDHLNPGVQVLIKNKTDHSTR